MFLGANGWIDRKETQSLQKVVAKKYSSQVHSLYNFPFLSLKGALTGRTDLTAECNP